MTDDEISEWGRMEFEWRLKELENRTPEGLRQAQANARRRARQAGLSESAASHAVAQARREWRKQQEADHG